MSCIRTEEVNNSQRCGINKNIRDGMKWEDGSRDEGWDETDRYIWNWARRCVGSVSILSLSSLRIRATIGSVARFESDI
jgi:hypothetical protein